MIRGGARPQLTTGDVPASERLFLDGVTDVRGYTPGPDFHEPGHARTRCAAADRCGAPITCGRTGFGPLSDEAFHSTAASTLRRPSVSIASTQAGLVESPLLLVLDSTMIEVARLAPGEAACSMQRHGAAL